jgi:hypothetical protein
MDGHEYERSMEVYETSNENSCEQFEVERGNNLKLGFLESWSVFSELHSPKASGMLVRLFPFNSNSTRLDAIEELKEEGKTLNPRPEVVFPTIESSCKATCPAKKSSSSSVTYPAAASRVRVVSEAMPAKEGQERAKGRETASPFRFSRVMLDGYVMASLLTLELHERYSRPEMCVRAEISLKIEFLEPWMVNL